jgi:peptidoglycan/xylan/chitin deacetylase (PgdA/CDA1 family)
MNNRYSMPLGQRYTCDRNDRYALTFDDGPGDNWPRLLEILEEHSVKATFFVVGLNLEDPAKRRFLENAYNAGHQIANHTNSHLYLAELEDERVLDEVVSVRERIVEILGEGAGSGAMYVRPPFGDITPRIARLLDENGYVPVRWNSDRYDWKVGADGGTAILERLGNHLGFAGKQGRGVSRAILDLNHSGSAATLSVLPEMITMIRDAGYDFVTVGECLGG